jgi:hypothetical protein
MRTRQAAIRTLGLIGARKLGTTPGRLALNAGLEVLALPLRKLRALPDELLQDALVIDAMNHWEPVHGAVEVLGAPGPGTSFFVQELLRRQLGSSDPSSSHVKLDHPRLRAR